MNLGQPNFFRFLVDTSRGKEDYLPRRSSSLASETEGAFTYAKFEEQSNGAISFALALLVSEIFHFEYVGVNFLGRHVDTRGGEEDYLPRHSSSLESRTEGALTSAKCREQSNDAISFVVSPLVSQLCHFESRSAKLLPVSSRQSERGRGLSAPTLQFSSE